MPRGSMPGPRTAAWYANRYGLPVREGMGTREQEQLFALQRAQGSRIAQRTETPRLGRFRDMAAPTAAGKPERPFPETEADFLDMYATPKFLEKAKAISLERAKSDLRTAGNITAYASTPAHAQRALREMPRGAPRADGIHYENGSA